MAYCCLSALVSFVSQGETVMENEIFLDWDILDDVEDGDPSAEPAETDVNKILDDILSEI